MQRLTKTIHQSLVYVSLQVMFSDLETSNLILGDNALL